MRSQEVNREQIVRALPAAIERLSASLEAGRTFDEAIEDLVATPDNGLAEAFRVMMAEVLEGVPRREAIRSMAQRLDVPELTALIEDLVKADEEGTPIVEVLRAQSGQRAM